MTATHDIDYDYDFRKDANGFPYLPDNLTKCGNLYVLPSGKYLPPGAYITPDGGSLIYEPGELSPFADILASLSE